MLISDLEHLSDLQYSALAETSNLLGGASDNVISLSLSKGILSLKLNDLDIFSTPYVGVPPSLIVSLDGVSNLNASSKVETVNGVMRSSWTLSSGALPTAGITSLFGFLPKSLLS